MVKLMLAAMFLQRSAGSSQKAISSSWHWKHTQKRKKVSVKWANNTQYHLETCPIIPLNSVASSNHMKPLHLIRLVKEADERQKTNSAVLIALNIWWFKFHERMRMVHFASKICCNSSEKMILVNQETAKPAKPAKPAKNCWHDLCSERFH